MTSWVPLNLATDCSRFGGAEAANVLSPKELVWLTNVSVSAKRNNIV